MNIAIFLSLLSLSLGLFTSMTFTALSHVFIVIPCLFFISKSHFRSLKLSSWCLIFLCIAIVISITINQAIVVDGYRSLGKIKYYLIAVLSIAPITSYVKNALNETHAKWLLWSFLGTTTLAGISGMWGVFFGFNFLLLKSGYPGRNGGLAGMLMNYAHNLAFFEVILLGLILEYEQIKNLINKNALIVIFVINLISLYTTYTRGSILAFLLAIPFYYFNKNKLKFLLVSALALLIIISTYKFTNGSFIRPESDTGRISQWKAAIVAFKQHPVFGVGFMNFEKLSQDIKQKNHILPDNFAGHAHNNYLEMLATTGSVGFIFFILWQIFWFIESARKNDLISMLSIPFIISFIVGGLSQSTFILGANLFFIMTFYSLSQVSFNKYQ